VGVVAVVTVAAAVASTAAAKPKPLPRRAPADIAKLKAQAARLPEVVPPGVVVPMHLTAASGQGPRVGWVVLLAVEDYADVAMVLADIPPSYHGFHVRDGRSCERGAEGAHWDPERTGKHKGPGGNGHRGDLRRLLATPDGTVQDWGVGLNARLVDLAGKLLVIDSGDDNYRDSPQRDGGGGEAIACGVIPSTAGQSPPAKK
jgi:superoxide dismutase, Cu-Zn family